jgi:hypothetical protein
MYFDDLTAYCYCLPFDLLEVRNIGWLDTDHAYAKGVPSGILVSKLRDIICARSSHSNAHVNVIRGIHLCNLCGEKRVEVNCRSSKVILGMSEILIPASHGYFASPSMVLHYIELHQYAPPQEYISAVMNFDLGEPFIAQEAYDNLVAQLA